MESKLARVCMARVATFALLIEPVWNRNRQRLNGMSGLLRLLIEPVWNRNVLSRLLPLFSDNLLIEPVWNRNRNSSLWECPLFLPFNRTSMESKRPDSAKWSRCRCLLIEPVWNRNYRCNLGKSNRNYF